MFLPLVVTLPALAAAWWSIVRLPRFWRSPRPLAAELAGMEPAQAARAVPALAVLGTPLLGMLAVVAWLERGEDDGTATWVQTVVSINLAALFLLVLGAGHFGRPRFAVPPALRPDLHDAPLHDAVIHRLPVEHHPFAAICECGWTDTDHATEGQARAAATKHTTRVRAGVERHDPL